MGNATVAGSAKPRAGSWNLGAAQLSRRHVGDGAEEIRPLDEVAVDDVVASTPWRTFRWYAGQQHYSGTYWAATESDHVIYESRLELARLLFADFDVGVQRIAAQPFLLSCSVGGKE
ncbi:transposase, partial [Streptomyces parvulus]